MRYESIDADLTLDTARQRIVDNVSGVRVTEGDGQIEVRMPSGLKVATLSEITLPSGDHGTRLRYRTVFIRPHMAHARRAATEIKKILTSTNSSEG